MWSADATLRTVCPASVNRNAVTTAQRRGSCCHHDGTVLIDRVISMGNQTSNNDPKVQGDVETIAEKRPPPEHQQHAFKGGLSPHQAPAVPPIMPTDLSSVVSTSSHFHGKAVKPQRGKKKKAARRRSSASTGSKNKQQQLQKRITLPVADCEPRRIVNPLITEDFWDVVSVYFWRPDTYSVVYAARLLGYAVPKAKAVPASWNPSKQKLLASSLTDSAVYDVPQEGIFARKIRESTGDEALGDTIDPVYVELLKNPRPAETTPVTAAQNAKLTATASTENLSYVLDLAMELGLLLPASWTVMTNVNATVDADATASNAQGVESVPSPAADLTLPCGFYLCYNGTASGLVRYDFVWYRFTDFELVLNVHDIMSARSFFSEEGTLNEKEEILLLVLVALVLEHARVSNVWYITFEAPASLKSLLETCFRMSYKDGVFVCDVHKCNHRYAFYKYSQRKQKAPTISETPTYRFLARLPTIDDAEMAWQENSPSPTTKVSNRKPSRYFSGAPSSMRQNRFQFKAVLGDNDLLSIQSNEWAPIEVPAFRRDAAIDIFRCFELPSKPEAGEIEQPSDLLRCLEDKQAELRKLELKMQPKIDSLMQAVVEERMEYEKNAESRRRVEENRFIEEYMRKCHIRKQLAQKEQEQLEQDMNAICAVCNDGEVAPGNQILFCEGCNVAVHQMCYGIDRVPEGDYYCIPCRYLGRDKSVRSRPGTPKLPPSLLPICCELCPRKQGAFLRTQTDEPAPFGKWVHAVCAKWQGLNYVHVPDVVEDVTELKMGFRRLDIKCELCLGERGGMNKCRRQDCNKWIHVTCARATGLCEVVHGEDVVGPVQENPWTLLCSEHSHIKPEDIPTDSVSVESLIQLAKEFPPEPKPPPAPIPPKPFNVATGAERRLLLQNKNYERLLLQELTKKRLYGVRCEVCDQDFETRVATRTRCVSCGIIFCDDCSLETDRAEGAYTCAACSYVASKRKSHEEFEKPQCVACCQPGGWLRAGFATSTRKLHWKQKKNESEVENTLFGKQLWVHSLCAL